MIKEIVIAAYDKNIDWIDKINNGVLKTIYRKGYKSDNENEIFIEPNVGRCVHTFFNHIYQRYDSLSDYTFFCQDFPFDHWENIIDIINSDISSLEKYTTLRIDGYYAFHYNTIGEGGGQGVGGAMWRMIPTVQFVFGQVLTCNSDGTPQDTISKINVNNIWKILFDEECPHEYEFVPGGHFVISKNQILIRSREFYKKICDILIQDESAPWAIERLECYIFNSKYKTKN